MEEAVFEFRGAFGGKAEKLFIGVCDDLLADKHFIGGRDRTTGNYQFVGEGVKVIVRFTES